MEEKRTKEYCRFLKEQERCRGTIEKYIRDVEAFFAWKKEGCLSRQWMIEWKDFLIQKGYAPSTINSMLSSMNSYLRFCERDDCRVRLLRIQRKIFRDSRKVMKKREYIDLLKTAKKQNKERLALLIECIACTGIRVSEVKYITVEALRKGRTDIYLKGKIRTIMIQKKLCRKLMRYAEKKGIFEGAVFLTRTGRNLGRKQIWREMKTLAQSADIVTHKIFPHNLRHLFAESFYKVSHDIVKLADVLGHSSVETTRIYLLTSGEEHRRQLEKIPLLLV